MKTGTITDVITAIIVLTLRPLVYLYEYNNNYIITINIYRHNCYFTGYI